MQFLLMTIQLSISIMAFVFVGAFALDKYEQYKSAKKLFNVDRILYIYRNSTTPIDTSNLVKVFDEIKKLEGKKLIKSFKTLEREYCYFPELESVAKKDPTGDSYNTMILVSEEFMNDYDLRIKEGRNFTKEDFDLSNVKDEESIIIGEGLSKYLKVGQVISVNYDLPIELLSDVTSEELCYTRKYKVIGIAEKNSLMDLQSLKELSGVVIDDYAIYKPFNKVKTFYITSDEIKIGEINELEKAINDFNSVIEVADGVDIEQLINDLNNMLKENDLPQMEFVKLSDQYNRTLDENKNMFIQMIGITLIILLFSASGTLGTILFLLRKRYKEFGIRLSLGATVNDIVKLVLSEIILMGSIAMFIGYIGAYLLLMENILYNVDILLQRMMWFSLIIFIPLLGLLVITSSIRLKKINPVELLRGES